MRKCLNIQFETEYNTTESMISIIDITDSVVTIYFPLLSIHKLYNYVNNYILEIEYDDSKIYYNIDTYNNLACVPFTYKGNQYYEYTNIIDCEYVNNLDIVNISMYPIKSYIDDFTTYNYNDYIYDWSDIGQCHIVMTRDNKLQSKIEYSQGFIFLNVTSSYNYLDYNVKCDISIIDINSNILYNSEDMIINEFSNIVYDENSKTYVGSWFMDISKILSIDNNIIPFDYGMLLTSMVRICSPDSEFDDEDEISSIISNQITITPHVYQDMLFWYDIHNIEDTSQMTIDHKLANELIESVNEILNDDDMNIINIVNKTVSDSESTPTIINNTSTGLIQPKFYRYSDIENIILRTNIIDRIQLNLDIYKSKVDSFYLNISSTNYPEIGRVSGGIIFAIDGSNLISGDSGRYYILDQDYEVVTSGEYTVE